MDSKEVGKVSDKEKQYFNTDVCISKKEYEETGYAVKCLYDIPELVSGAAKSDECISYTSVTSKFISNRGGNNTQNNKAPKCDL